MSTVPHHDQILSRPAISDAESAAPRRSRIGVWLLSAVPSAVVIAALIALVAWGHSTEWTMPKFSALVGQRTSAATKWCKDHNVPEAACIECNLDLVPPLKDYGWCKEHGVAQCPLEHPDIAQAKTAPTITPAMLDRASRALAVKSRDENGSRCTLYKRRIQFASAQAVERAGIDIAIVHERPIMEALVTNGEVVYDETRMAHLPSRVAGTAWRVAKRIGDRVKKGDVLALVDAAEVGRAKSEFLQAIAQARLRQATVERLQSLAEGTVAGRQLREAVAAHDEARIRLQSAQQALVNLGLPVKAVDFASANIDDIARKVQFLGVPTEFVVSLDADAATSNLFPLRSPLDGVVIDRHLVEGGVVDTTAVLFTVADVSHLWLTLSLREDDAKYVALGQPALFRPNNSTVDADVTGSVGWISTSADDQTRTVKVRVDLSNIDGRLRANTFGTGRIVLRDEPKAIVVPSEAVHWDGTCHVVFVRDKNYLQSDSPKFFHVRTVRPGVKDGDTTEIISGVLPDEVIASRNSVVLQAQLLKSNLGAGCCEACMVKVKN